MKFVVFPASRRAEVETALEPEFEHRGGTENLTLTITRLTASKRWAVHATGLDDEVLERGFCDLVQHVLNDTGI
jgi:hypothetical protein